MKLIHASNVLLLAGLFGLSLYVYPDLPAQIPTHFGPGGEPDSWSEKSVMTWLMLPLFAAGTAILLYIVAAAMPTNPSLVNMPNKDRLLKLPKPLQQWVLEVVRNFLYMTAWLMLIMFALLQLGAYEAALTERTGTALKLGLVVGLAGTPMMTIGLLIQLQRRMDAAWREYQTRGDAATVPG